MGFVLEKLTEEQFAEYNSKANNEAIRQAKVYGGNEEYYPTSPPCWVIDRKRNAYFYKVSVIDHSGPSARFYLLNFEGCSIIVRIGRFQKVSPLVLPATLEPRLGEIRQAILDALAVLGYGGLGRLNEFDTLLPKFE